MTLDISLYPVDVIGNSCVEAGKAWARTSDSCRDDPDYGDVIPLGDHQGTATVSLKSRTINGSAHGQE